jgi:ABC-type transport system involved in multi-copper enzyme maturation permease subunit
MKALLRKDWHVNRAVLLATAGGFVLPYLVGTFLNLMSLWRNGDCMPWPSLLAFSGLWSLGISFGTITFLAGNAIAGERADRSAEFFAYLPVPRRDALLSRIVVALTPALLVWLINLAIVFSVPWFGEQHLPRDVRQLAQLRDRAVAIIALITVLAFGVAWLCTSLLRSPAIAASLGLLAPGILFVVLETMKEIAYARHAEFDDGLWYAWLAPVLACLAFATGCVYYLRRVEP